MRRRLLLLALCGVLLGTSVPAASGPVRDDYWAMSWFFVPTEQRDVFEMYAAFVLYGGDVGSAPHTHGGLLTGTCRRQIGPNGSEEMNCRGSGSSIRASDDFKIAPDASKASLRAERKDHEHELRWTATDEPPSTASWAEACTSGQGEGIGLSRLAAVRGRLFDRRLVSKPDDQWQLHFLAHGVTVTQCLPGFSRDELADLLDGGGFSVRF